MTVQVDIPGIGTVAARNAATESTLRELVNAIKSLQKVTGDLGTASLNATKSAQTKTSKPMPGSSGSGAISAKATQLAEKSVNKMAGAANGVAATLGTLAGTVVGTGKAFTELGIRATETISQMASIGDSVRDAAGALNKIPIIGGVLARALGPVASALEATTGSYQAAAGAGANFGGSVLAMSRAAGEAGMTMQEFGNLIKGNGEAMLGLGTNVEDGARRFSQISKAIRTTGSDLFALGFSTQEINQGLANYTKQLRMQGLQGGKTNADIAKGTKAYLKEMDALAKLTGEERSAKEAERERLMQEAQFQASMAGLQKPVRDSFLAVVQSMPSKELQNFAQDLMATGTATTEESQALMAQMPETARLLTEFHAKQQRGEAVTLEERARINDMMAREGPRALESIKYAAAAGGVAAGTVNALASTQKLQIGAVQASINAQNQSTAATDGQNQAMEQAKAALAKFSNEFQMALANTGMLDVLMSAFRNLAGFVDAVVVPAFRLFGDAIQGAMNFVKQAFSVVGIGDTFGTLKETTNKIFDSVRRVASTVSGFFMDLIVMIDWDSIKQTARSLFTTVKDFFTSLFNAINWKAVGTTLSDTFKQSMEMAKSLFTTISNLFTGIIRSINWNAIMTNAMTIFNTAKDLFQSLVTSFTPVIQDILAIVTNLGPKLQPIFQDIGVILSELGAKIAPIFQTIAAIIQRVVEVVAPLLRPILSSIGTVLGGFFDMLGGLVMIVKGILTGDLSTIGDGFRDVFGGFVDAIFGMFDAIKNVVSGGVRAVWNFLTGGTPENPPAPPKPTPEQTKQAGAEAEAEKKRLEEATRREQREQRLEAERRRQEEERARRENERKAASAREAQATQASIDASNQAAKDSAKVDLGAGPEEQFRQFAQQQRAMDDKGNLVGMGQAPSVRSPVREAASAASTAGERATTGTSLVGQPSDLNKYLKTIAMIESGGNPEAMAKTSSASGMFQFTKGTWEQMTKEMGVNYSLADRFDPKRAEEVAAYFTSKQKTQLEKGIGREASSTDLYMSHFLGAGGATKFLNAMGKDPSQSAAALDPRAAAANKNIYYDKQGKERTVQEVYDLMANKVARAESQVDRGRIPEAVAAISQGRGQALAGATGTAATAATGGRTPGTIQPTGVAGVAPQESTAVMLSELNNNMSLLVNLMKINNDLTERQLSVSRSQSNDLFSSIG